ncbi:MAG: DinB family protein [Verrucomicrobiales bacterium]|nr:DinB family protein [Verrucomicrobiales bacterium]
MKQNDQPKLDKPGAGLPAAELWIARLRFRRAVKIERSAARDLFLNEKERIGKISKPQNAERFGEPVLIRRLPGMEDSSRFWSIWMVYEHLRIVNQAVALTIESLGKGKLPSQVADTADFKPDPQTTGSVLAHYEKSCETFLQSADVIADLHTPDRFDHPWFGPLNAHEWFVLGGFHMGIHRRQMEAIFQALS